MPSNNFTASCQGAWKAPAYFDATTVLTVLAFGAGGGGAGSVTNASSGGGGGGGGAAHVSMNLTNLAACSYYFYQVPRGGAAGAAASGSSGGTAYLLNTSADSTSFLVRASGGGGGAAYSGGGAGGAGGTTSTEAGSLGYAGGAGAAAPNNNTGGGSGGGAGTAGAGGTTTNRDAGAAGAGSYGGAGNNGGARNANGAAGTQAGGGGSGSGRSNGTARNGGAGAAGALYLSWTPAPALSVTYAPTADLAYAFQHQKVLAASETPSPGEIRPHWMGHLWMIADLSYVVNPEAGANEETLGATEAAIAGLIYPPKLDAVQTPTASLSALLRTVTLAATQGTTATTAQATLAHVLCAATETPTAGLRSPQKLDATAPQTAALSASLLLTKSQEATEAPSAALLFLYSPRLEATEGTDAALARTVWKAQALLALMDGVYTAQLRYPPKLDAAAPATADLDELDVTPLPGAQDLKAEHAATASLTVSVWAQRGLDTSVGSGAGITEDLTAQVFAFRDLPADETPGAALTEKPQTLTLGASQGTTATLSLATWVDRAIGATCGNTGAAIHYQLRRTSRTLEAEAASTADLARGPLALAVVLGAEAASTAGLSPTSGRSAELAAVVAAQAGLLYPPKLDAEAASIAALAAQSAFALELSAKWAVAEGLSYAVWAARTIQADQKGTDATLTPVIWVARALDATASATAELSSPEIPLPGEQTLAETEKAHAALRVRVIVPPLGDIQGLEAAEAPVAQLLPSVWAAVALDALAGSLAGVAEVGPSAPVAPLPFPVVVGSLGTGGGWVPGPRYAVQTAQAWGLVWVEAPVSDARARGGFRTRGAGQAVSPRSRPYGTGGVRYRAAAVGVLDVQSLVTANLGVIAYGRVDLEGSPSDLLAKGTVDDVLELLGMR